MIARVKIGSPEEIEVTIKSGQSRAVARFSHGTTSPPNSRREVHGVRRSAIQNPQLLDAAIAKVPHDLLACSARSDDQRAVIVQLAENPFRKFHPRKCNRNGPRAEFRFVPDALAHFKSGLEHAIEYGTGFATVKSDLVSIAYLAQNFRLAEQHGIEPGCDSEQVPHGMTVPVAIQRAIQFIERKLVEGRDEQFHGAGAIRGVLAWNAVEFAAIARGKHQRFLEDAARTQLTGGFARLLWRECDTLPQIDRGRAVI